MDKKVLLRAKALRRKLNKDFLLDQTGLVTFGCVREGEREDYEYIGGPCHMGLAGGWATKPTAVVSLINYSRIKANRHKSGYTIPYYRWLLNDSIYRDCFVTKSPIEAIHKGVICHTDVPSNLLLGALIATRYPWEYANKQFKTWCELYRRGVNPSMAFIVCHAALYSFKKLSFQGVLLRHNALDLHDMTERGMEVFLKGDRKRVFNKRRSLYVDNDYYGVTRAWQDDRDDATARTIIADAYKTSIQGVRGKKGLLGHRDDLYVPAKQAYDVMSKWAINYYEEVV